MKRLWRRTEYSEWDNECGVARTPGKDLYWFKNRPITYEEYRDRLMNYFKDYDEDY